MTLVEAKPTEFVGIRYAMSLWGSAPREIHYTLDFLVVGLGISLIGCSGSNLLAIQHSLGASCASRDLYSSGGLVVLNHVKSHLWTVKRHGTGSEHGCLNAVG